MKMVSSNSTANDYQIAALILEVSLAPIFVILLLPLTIMIVRRFQIQKSWKTQMNLNVLMISTWFYCLFEIVGNIIMGLGGFYELVQLSIYIASNCISYIHFALFAFVSMAYIYTLIKASISFEIIVSRTQDTRERRMRRKILFRTMRIGSLVVLILGSLLVTSSCICMCILYGLKQYNRISQSIYYPVMMSIVLIASIPTLIVYVLVLLVFVSMFIYTMRKSSQAIANQKDQTHKDKILDRKAKIVRHLLGFILYCLHALVVGISVIWYIARQSEGTPFESILIDILMRIIPTYIFLLVIIVVFWPYQIPKMLLNMYSCKCKSQLFLLLGRSLNTRIDLDTEEGTSTERTITEDLPTVVPVETHTDV